MNIRAIAALLCLLCAACGGKNTPPTGDESLCLDVKGVALMKNGVPLKSGTDDCKWLLHNLGGKPPCRTTTGDVVFDELGRAFPEGKYCSQALNELRRQKPRKAK